MQLIKPEGGVRGDGLEQLLNSVEQSLQYTQDHHYYRPTQDNPPLRACLSFAQQYQEHDHKTDW